MSVVGRIAKRLSAVPGMGGMVGLAAEVARPLRGRPHPLSHLVPEVAELRERLEALAGRTRAELDQLQRHLPTILQFLTRLDGDVAGLLAGQQRYEGRFGSWEAALNQARRDVAGMSELMHRQLGEVRERVEFIRMETLHEVRHGAARTAAAPAVESRVLDADKVAAMGDALRLNLGCGHVPMEGYVNVDARELPGVDVVADVTRVPFEPGRVAELFSSHLVEHFPREQLRRVVLPHWHGLLRPGGTLRAVLPDWDAMLRGYSEGRVPFEDLREVTFGGQEYEGDFHFNMYTPGTLKELLQETGFTDVEFPATGRVNGRCLEMEVRARRA